jgi:glutaconate CoA-transferase, subunit B
VKDCDFITNFGHRTSDGRRSRDLGHRGNGPQWLVTELGLFDFDADGHMRLTALYPDISVDDVFENTEFTPMVAAKIGTIPTPDWPVIELILTRSRSMKLRTVGADSRSLEATAAF